MFSLKLACCVSVLLWTVVYSQTEKDQVTALQDFYEYSCGVSWENQENWNDGGDPCNPSKKWYGVGCAAISPVNNKTVIIDLNLNANSLCGSFQASFAALSTLKILDLGSNSLTGSILSSIFLFSSLEKIDLSTNNFIGGFPSNANLPNLVHLDLSNNNLNGSISISDQTFPLLTLLDLSNNTFGGTIPAAISDLSRLKVLMLSHNSFDGTLAALNNPELTVLYLNNNNLLGHINTIATSVQYLSLGKNNFNGTFPEQIFQATYIKRIEANSNNFVEIALPSNQNWTATSQLESFNFADNSLSQDIPLELFSISTLELIDFSNNQFISGECASIIEALLAYNGQAISLLLRNNSIEGSLPSDVSNLHNITDIDLSFNLLNGTLPVTLNEVNFLLNISYNAFSPCISIDNPNVVCSHCCQNSNSPEHKSGHVIAIIVTVVGGVLILSIIASIIGYAVILWRKKRASQQSEKKVLLINQST